MSRVIRVKVLVTSLVPTFLVTANVISSTDETDYGVAGPRYINLSVSCLRVWAQYVGDPTVALANPAQLQVTNSTGFTVSNDIIYGARTGHAGLNLGLFERLQVLPVASVSTVASVSIFPAPAAGEDWALTIDIDCVFRR